MCLYMCLLIILNLGFPLFISVPLYNTKKKKKVKIRCSFSFWIREYKKINCVVIIA